MCPHSTRVSCSLKSGGAQGKGGTYSWEKAWSERQVDGVLPLGPYRGGTAGSHGPPPHAE